MIQSPFYKVYIDNDSKRDITDMVESFVYEDSMEEDNLLKLTIASVGLQAVEDTDFLTGVTLAFQFGYLAGEQSPIHRARITDRTPNYAQRVTIKLKCLDIGTTAKKVASGKVWENMTSTQIAEQIAAKYGLDLESVATTKVWEAIPQGNRSDLDFVKYLASREGDGNYISYIRNTTMYFVERATSDVSLVTYTYGNGDSKIISFSPSLKESSQKPESGSTTIPMVDALEAKVDNVVVDKDSETQTGTLGAKKRVYNENAEQVGTVTDISKLLTLPVQDKAEATSIGNAAKKSSTLTSQVAKLKIVGSPLITPNNILTINGVAPSDAGNWLVSKIVHSVSPSGYTSDVSLQKNGAKRENQMTEKAADSNESIGTEEGVEPSVKLRVFDGNGDFLRYSSEDRNASKNK